MVLKSLFTGLQWRNRYRVQTYGHSERGGEDKMYGKSNMETYITICKIDSQWAFAVQLRKLREKAMAPHSSNSCLGFPGKSHGWRSLVGCSPWGREESDTTKRLHFYFLLSCIGKGNGNPLQCSCLENPKDGRAWWAAVYGVAQSRTQLKQLSSSSACFTQSKLSLLQA